MSSKRIAILLICMTLFAVAAALCVSIFSYSDGSEKESWFNNPLYPEYASLGKKYGIDVSFTRKVCNNRFNKLINDSIVSTPPRSLDTIIIGDSTVSWGLIPGVVESASGLKTGMISYESLYLTYETARAINVIADYFLKPDGTIVLSFSEKFQSMDPETKLGFLQGQIVSISRMKGDEFAAFIRSMQKTESGRTVGMNHFLNYGEYRKLHATVNGFLRKELFMQLPDISFYASHIEAYVNPALHRIKARARRLEREYLCWDDQCIVIYNRNVRCYSRRSNGTYSSEYSNRNVEKIAAEVKKIPFKKVFLVTLSSSDERYRTLGSIYRKYYSGFTEVADMGMLQSPRESYPMSDRRHMMNTGSFQQSLLLGEWLKSRHARSMHRSR